MPKVDDPLEEARSLDARLDALEARRAVKPAFAVDAGASEGYRVLADLIGGVLGGLGFGWLFDRLVGSSPWGLIGGVLLGTGFSVFVIVRKASRMNLGGGPAAAPAETAPIDDDDDDDRLEIFGLRQGDD